MARSFTGSQAWKHDPATNAQLNFIRSLSERTGYEPNLDLVRTKGDASRMIDWLKKQPAGAGRKAAHKVNEDILPKRMLDLIDEGRYAITTDDNTQHIFLRVSRPKSGQYRNCTKIQTQHSDAYTTQLVVAADGRVLKRRHSRIKGMELKDVLVTLLANQRQAAVEYGQKIQQCCRCGRELTDERSAYMGIGPECEQHWPWIIEMVEDTKGSYAEHVARLARAGA